MTSAQAFETAFRPWLANRVELSFGADPDRHGTMTNGQGQGAFEAIESYASTVPFASRWIDNVRRFCGTALPFGYFCKADWHRAEVDRLTVYCRFRNGSIEQGRLEESAGAGGFEWPSRPLAHAREALGTEPFLVGLRVDRDGRRHLSVYYVIKPSFDALVGELMPALAGACALPPEVSRIGGADLRMLHEPESYDRLGLELGVQCSEGSAEVRATAYLREISRGTALRFVAAAGAADAVTRRLTELSEALPSKRFLYVGVRYGQTGRSGLSRSSRWAGSRSRTCCAPASGNRLPVWR